MNITLIATGSRPWELWLRHWGLSYLIDGTILYDTFGNYPALARRLARAGVDIAAIQSVVISHDHWDHIGGLWTLLGKRAGLDVYVPQTVSADVKARIVACGGRVVDASGVKTLKENIFVSDEIMGAFDGTPIAEQCIAIKGSRGLTLLVGCSHPGIVTMVRKAREAFGMPVYGVIGGLHLFQSGGEDVRQCINALKQEGVTMLAPTHCTGWRAERAFRKAFGEGFIALREGESLAL